MWQKLDLLLSVKTCDVNLFPLVRDLNKHVKQIEAICSRNGLTPAHLEVPTHQVFCWMKFLTENDSLTRHLMALSIAKQVLSPFANKQKPVILHLINTTGLWRMRSYSDAVVIKASEGFIAAGENVWRALMGSILTSNADDRALVKEFARSEEFSGVLGEMESLAEAAHTARGHAHDLEESFARVNAAYFSNALTKPGLRWSSVLTSRKFGHYQMSRDAIMLSATLDNAKVPTWVVDFVMYHELLHKTLGVVWNGGRSDVAYA